VSGGVFEANGKAFELALPGFDNSLRVNVTSQGGSKAKNRLTITHGRFLTAEDALAAGKPLKQALLLAGLLFDIGIDVGNEAVLSGPAHRADGKVDESLQPDVHGLLVYPEGSSQVWFGFFGEYSVETPITPASFQSKIAECFFPKHSIGDKVMLAAQLFSQSFFLTSAKARFITLISAVEVLAEPKESSARIVELVSGLLTTAQAATGVDADEQQSLVDRLRYLKRESIGAACRRLVAKNLGSDKGKLFRKLYDIRSMLVHKGHSPPPDLLSEQLRELQSLVRFLLVKEINAGLAPPAPAR